MKGLQLASWTQMHHRSRNATTAEAPTHRSQSLPCQPSWHAAHTMLDIDRLKAHASLHAGTGGVLSRTMLAMHYLFTRMGREANPQCYAHGCHTKALHCSMGGLTNEGQLYLHSWQHEHALGRRGRGNLCKPCETMSCMGQAW